MTYTFRYRAQGGRTMTQQIGCNFRDLQEPLAQGDARGGRNDFNGLAGAMTHYGAAKFYGLFHALGVGCLA